MAVKKARPSYTMWQNSLYMIRLAWQNEKSVIGVGIIEAVIAVGLGLVNLLVTPAILHAVQTRASFAVLLGIIGLFVVLLMLLHAGQQYINATILYPRITLRTILIGKVLAKRTKTSYPNLGTPEFKVLEERSNKAMESNQAPTEAIWTTLTKLLQNVLGFIVYLLFLSQVNLFLVAVIILTAGIGYFINHYVNEYHYHHREEIAKHSKKLWYIKETAGDTASAKDIRIFGLRSWLEEVRDKAMNAYDAYYQKLAAVYLIGNITDLLMVLLRNGLAYLYLIGLVLNKAISPAEFLLYFTAVQGFSTWVSGILESMSTLHQQSLEICSVRELQEYAEPFLLEEGEHLIIEPEKAYEICLEDVSFRYPGAEKDTLSHINLTLSPGEKLAIVGLNGAGKTTLVKILCGFLDPTEGRVLLNGKDIRLLNRRDYYQMFSAVFQQFSVLAATIAENVTQSKLKMDMERVQRSIASAGLTEKVESLPEGYQTFLEKSVYQDAIMLSGGEMQRLMLARALYKDAPMIILDEPTAALDPLAEEDIYQRYHEMTLGKSSVYISHRLASTRFCDRIILLQDGKIREEGTHAQLLAQDGIYAALFNVQSEYYK